MYLLSKQQLFPYSTTPPLSKALCPSRHEASPQRSACDSGIAANVQRLVTYKFFPTSGLAKSPTRASIGSKDVRIITKARDAPRQSPMPKLTGRTWPSTKLSGVCVCLLIISCLLPCLELPPPWSRWPAHCSPVITPCHSCMPPS